MQRTTSCCYSKESLESQLALLTDTESKCVRSSQIQPLLRQLELGSLDFETFLMKCLEKLPKSKVTILSEARQKVIGQWNLVETAVSGRQLARWGVAGSVLNNKWYLFGGRGADNFCRNSLHVIDLASLSVQPLKTAKSPKKREGHSCVLFNDWLVIFGGCEGGDDDTESFNDICIYDTKGKAWSFPQCRGKLPTGREGHAAGMVNDHYMLVYGGNSSRLYNDVYVLNLKNFIWIELTVSGTSPGPRESMAYTTLRNMLFIFGGNSSASATAEPQDEFNNDLYSVSLSLQDNDAVCNLMRTDGPAPPKRLSHSMSSLDSDRLITYGGEGKESILSDVWVYNLNEGHWREVVVSNTIPGRMSHTLYAYSNRLLVFGGMNSEQSVTNEIAMLDLEDSLIQGPPPPQKQDMVKGSLSNSICNCGHSPSTCDFLRRFPEVSYPKVHFFVRCQIPLGCMQELTAKYTDPVACLFFISQQVSSTHCTIKAFNDVVVDFKGAIKHLVPTKHTLDLSFMPITETDDTVEIRRDLLKKWSSDRDYSRARVLMVSGDKPLSPDLFLASCVGSSNLNLIVPCLALSSTAVLVNKTKEFICIALVTKTSNRLPCYAVVFDIDLRPLFPSVDLFDANLKNILDHCSFSLASLSSVAEGLTVFLYCEGLDIDGEDLVFKKSQLTVLKFLTVCYFEAPGSVSYTLQDTPVKHTSIHDRCLTPAKFRTRELDIYECSAKCAKLFVFFNNCLIYTRPANTEAVGHKRPRSDVALSKVLIMKSRRFISHHTSQLEWNEELMSVFSAANSGDYAELQHLEGKIQGSPNRFYKVAREAFESSGTLKPPGVSQEVLSHQL